MPYYLKIETESFGALTAQTGGDTVAKRLANTNSSVAGDDFCYVYGFDFSVEQPHNQLQGNVMSQAHALHAMQFTLPDYEPLTANVLNVLAGQDVIQRATFNIAAVQEGKPVLLTQYTMEQGMITHYAHRITDQRHHDQSRQRGQVHLHMCFERINVEDHVVQTHGLLTTHMQ